jgi:hypothetical protein
MKQSKKQIGYVCQGCITTNQTELEPNKKIIDACECGAKTELKLSFDEKSVYQTGRG